MNKSHTRIPWFTSTGNWMSCPMIRDPGQRSHFGGHQPRLSSPPRFLGIANTQKVIFPQNKLKLLTYLILKPLFAINVWKVKVWWWLLTEYNTISLHSRGCPELPVDNGIYYSPSYSCRQVCSMSSETTRGCVMVRPQLSDIYHEFLPQIGMHLENLPVSTYCNYTEDLSKIEYLT